MKTKANEGMNELLVGRGQRTYENGNDGQRIESAVETTECVCVKEERKCKGVAGWPMSRNTGELNM